MSDFDKTRRQDVQTEAPKKLLQRERHRSALTLMGIIFTAEGAGAILEIQRARW